MSIPAACCRTWGRTSSIRRLALFGKPEGVSAEVLRERDGAGANDSFTIRLRYPGLIVTVASNLLSLKAAPRFRLRGTRGGY